MSAGDVPPRLSHNSVDRSFKSRPSLFRGAHESHDGQARSLNPEVVLLIQPGVEMGDLSVRDGGAGVADSQCQARSCRRVTRQKRVQLREGGGEEIDTMERTG